MFRKGMGCKDWLGPWALVELASRNGKMDLRKSLEDILKIEFAINIPTSKSIIPLIIFQFCLELPSSSLVSTLQRF
jgi:hypothetical protein